MGKELRVLISDEQIGSVHQNPQGRLTFTYDDIWRQRLDALPLSLSMPLTQGEHGSKVTENYIWGLISDDPQTRDEMAKRKGVSPRSAFALMANYGEDTVGAIQMVLPDSSEQHTGRLHDVHDAVIAIMMMMTMIDATASRSPPPMTTSELMREL